MSIEELMKYYDLNLDDIRWYLASLITFKIQELQTKPEDITRYIWSGELESELYNIEENFLNQLKDEIDQDRIDEGHLRELFNEIKDKKIKRFES